MSARGDRVHQHSGLAPERPANSPEYPPNSFRRRLAVIQRARDQSRQRRQPDKGPGMNKANDGNAREISRQLGHNSRNFHENNPNFRRARRFFRAQRPGIRESSSHFRAESQ